MEYVTRECVMRWVCCWRCVGR